MALLLAATLGASWAVWAHADSPPGLAPAWSAHLSCGFLETNWCLDLTTTGPRFRQITTIPSILYGTSRKYTEDTYGLDASNPSHTDVVYSEGGDDVCAPDSRAPISFMNPFVTTMRDPRAKWTGGNSTVIGGHPCTVWGLGGTYVCIAADGSPVELAFPQSNFTCMFSDVKLGLDEALLAPNSACTRYPTPACPSQATAEVTVYRLGSAVEPLVLDDRDTSDLPATPTIICAWPETATSYVSAWAVTASAAWGQYGRCHYNGTNYCDAQTGKQVGRQSPQGVGSVAQVGHLQGQCSPNKGSGSWISFPASGKCGPGKAVGEEGCTWSAKRSRTIYAKCIVTNPAFRAACAAELGRGPSNPIAASFVAAAFASDDPSKGGCPEVPLSPIVV